MKKFLQNLLLIALLCVPWVSMSQGFSFTCDFEDNTDTAAWDYVNSPSSASAGWFIGEGAQSTGLQGLYVSDDGGVSPAYPTEEADYYAYRTIHLVAGTYQYSYDWFVTGVAGSEYMRVALVPAATTLPATASEITTMSLPTGWIAMDNGELSDGWEAISQSGNVVVPTEGDYKLVVFFRCEGYGYYMPGVIDNISLVLPNINCPDPSNITFPNITATSATAKWQHAGGSATAWKISYASQATPTAITSQVIYEDSIVLSNLTPNTEYNFTVQSICGIDSSSVVSATFRTNCSDIVLPYHESFENNTEEQAPSCWTVLNGEVTVRETYGSDPDAIDGRLYLKMKGSASVVSSYIPTAGNMLDISIAAKVSSLSAGKVQVLFATDLSQIDNATLLYTIDPTDGMFHVYEFDGATSGITTGGYLVLKKIDHSSSYSYFAIDDIRINQLSDCRRPAFITASNITYQGATLTWASVEGAYAYEVVYGTVNDPTSTQNTVLSELADTTVEISNLTPETEYFMWVRNICGEEYSSWRKGGSFSTTIACAQVVNFETIEVTSSGISIAWQYNTAVGIPATKTEVAWKSATETSFHKAITDNTYYIIQGLQATTTYEVQLRTICGTDTSSVFTTTIPTTLYGHTIEGNHSSTDDNLPTNSYYKYSYSQMVYLASEMMGVDTIRSIAFNYAETIIPNRTWDIYMGHIMRSKLGQNNYVSVDSLTLVVSDYTFTSHLGWCTIPLDTTFVYHSDSNLVVAVYDKTGSAKQGLEVYTHNGSAVNFRNDYTVITPQNPGYLNNYTKVADIAFPQTPVAGGCEAPMALISSIATDNATLVWNNGIEGTTWQVEYRLADATSWTVANAAVTDTTFIISDLIPGSVYQFRVGANCGSSIKYSSLMEGTTMCVAIEAPYFQDFSRDELPPCLTVGNLNGSVLPSVGSEALYMSFADNGYVILPEFVNDINTLQLIFSTKTTKDSASFVVMVGSDPTNINSFVAIDTFTTRVKNQYIPHLCQFDSYEGEDHYIAILSLRQYSYIDDIQVEEIPNCGYPTDLAISEVEANSATISWSNNIGTTLSWLVVYNIKDSPICDTIEVAASDYSAVITNLVPNTNYEARVYNICASDTLASLMPVAFKTACGDITLPYLNDFENESDGQYPDCWFSTNMHEVGSGWSAATFPSIDEAYSDGLRLVFSDNVNIITPHIPGDASAIQVVFDAKVEDAMKSGKLAVGITPSATDVSQAIFVDTITFSNNRWNTYTISMESIPANTDGYVIFSNLDNVAPTNNYNSYKKGFIDNLIIMIDYGCEDVTDVKMSDVTATTATISFTDLSDANDYTIGYSAVNDVNNITNTLDCTDTTATLTDLLPFTRYYTWVRTNCNGGSSLWLEGPTFKTVCHAIAELPYTENFDSYTSGISYSTSAPSNYPDHTLPNCWTVTNMSNNSGIYPQAFIMKNTAASKIYADSAACFLMRSGADKPIYAALPSFETHVSDLQLSFTYTHEGVNSNNGHLALGVMTDVSDPATFTVIREYPQVGTVIPVIHNFSLDNLDAATDYVIAFRYTAGEGTKYSIGIDNIKVEQAATCVVPEMITLTSISESEATFVWDSVATSYNVQYRELDSTEWHSVASVDTSRVVLTGLSSQTDYQVRMQSICGTATSEWSSAINFSTTCGTMSLPYTEDFDSYTTDISSGTGPQSYPNHTMPDCWSFPQLGLQYGKAFLSNRTGYPVTGNCLYFISSSSQYVHAVLPAMDASIKSLQLKFTYRNEGKSNSNPQIELGVMTNPDDPSTFISLELYPRTDIKNTIEHQFSGDSTLDNNINYYIAFRFGGASNNYYAAIDNVEVDVIPTCIAPTDVEVSAITTNTANVTWTSDATDFQVSYKSTADEDWTIVPATGNTCALSNLNPSSDYQVRVRAICTVGDTSRWSIAESFATACGVINLPYSQDFTGINYISALNCWSEYDGILSDVLSGNAHLTSGSDWDISDRHQVNYGGNCLKLNVCGATIASWLVSPSINISGATSLEFDMARYDYNLFYDEDDKFHVLISTDDGQNWQTVISWLGEEFDSIPSHNGAAKHIAIDLAQYVDDTIQFAFYGESTISGADHNILIDNITIQAPIAPCDAPTALAVANITDSSADLSWNGTSSAYDVEYRVAETEAWTSLTATETTLQLEGLEELTTYEWRVRGNCGANTSDWVSSTFTTLITPCDAPTALAVANITDSSADLSWNGTSSAYDVEYRVAETEAWTSLTATETTLQLEGLQELTAYEWRVRGNCGANTSDWVSSTFTTLVTPCDIPTALVAEVAETTVTLDWTAAEGQTSWEVSLTATGSDEQLQVVNAHPTTINNLAYSTTYTAKVRALCDETHQSDWSEAVEFTTPAQVCDTVNAVSISEITETSAVVTWIPTEGQSQWEVVYGELGFNPNSATVHPVDAPEYTMTDLTANTQYDVYVRTVCTDELHSDWCTKVSFVTLAGQEGINGVEGDIQFTIYPNPTHGSTTISLQGVEGKVIISIVDMNGRTINSETIECGVDCEKRIDVAGLAQGTYFVRILGDNLNSVRKLIVR